MGGELLQRLAGGSRRDPPVGRQPPGGGPGAGGLLQKAMDAGAGVIGQIPEAELQALREEGRELVLKRLPPEAVLKRGDPETERQVSRILTELVDRRYGPGEMPIILRRELVARLLDDLIGYGPLEPFLKDPEVTEIMVNRWDRIAVERNGQLLETEARFRDEKHLRDVIERMLGPTGRHIDDASPIVNARLPDGSRLNAIIPPVGVRGSALNIRKHRKPFTEEELVRLGTLTPDASAVLRQAVEARLNIVISGGTGSGKTSLTNYLVSLIPPGQRTITCEEVAEIQTDRFHHVSMESRPPNTEGRGEVTLRDLVINALRQRPDRIIVGECRAGEAWDMIQAMSTGHPGSMTTVHADEVEEAVERLVNMVLLAGKDLPVPVILRQIALAVDLILQMMRLPTGERKVVEVVEVAGVGEDGRPVLRPIYKLNPATGRLEPTGLRFTRAAERARKYGMTLKVFGLPEEE
ncbi:MAG: CpaF family protein [Bacillota bacterium]